MKNILLTGKKQVGKSTIINKIMNEYSGKICGFQTLRDHEEKRFYIKSASDDFNGNRKAFICKRTESNRFIGLTNTFENQGVAILNESLNQSPNLIIMDELGTFEEDAARFHKMIYKCFEVNIPVLGVLKDKPSSFLDNVRKQPNTVIYNVTEENRHDIFHIVKNSIVHE